jgi:hypothetical protein
VTSYSWGSWPDFTVWVLKSTVFIVVGGIFNEGLEKFIPYLKENTTLQLYKDYYTQNYTKRKYKIQRYSLLKQAGHATTTVTKFLSQVGTREHQSKEALLYKFVVCLHFNAFKKIY